MLSNKSCPLCNADTESKLSTTHLSFDITCSTCGVYTIRRAIADDIQHHSHRVHERKYVLSGLTREASDRGEHLTLSEDNLEQLLQSVSIPRQPIDSMNLLLEWFSRKAVSADQFVTVFRELDYPVCFARHRDEFVYFLMNLRDLGHIEPQPFSTGQEQYRLTPIGWNLAAELQRDNRDSNQAFMAMWFNEQTNPVYDDGFKVALESVGYNPIRIDLEQFNDKICDQIVAEIRRSGLLIADMTGNRGGVYFEAGFAMGLGIPVIWTCRHDHIDNVHFDTRQYNHIVWDDAEDLREKLAFRIEATIPGRVRRLEKEL